LRITRALLEDWLRDRYFEAAIDLGSSGVRPYTLRELSNVIGLDSELLQEIVLGDGRTLGQPGLRSAIANRWAGGRPDTVAITHGSSEAIFLLMGSLLRPGDEVVVVDPVYHSLVSVAEGIGCRVRRWALRFSEGYRPDIDAGLKLITEQTRMVILNFPHNPTGTSITDEGLAAIAFRTGQVGAWLVLDEAFRELDWVDRPDHKPTCDEGNVIRLGTLSKAFGLPGLRIGWCIAHPEILQRMVPLRDAISLFGSPLIEVIAQAVVEHGDEVVTARKRDARVNLLLLQEWMTAQAKLLEWVPPLGGVAVFPRVRGLESVDGFCELLLREHGTLIVPGRCFGHPNHFRLGFGGDCTSFREGLEQLGSALRRPDTALAERSAPDAPKLGRASRPLSESTNQDLMS
jgi:capreomycidine synthase